MKLGKDYYKQDDVLKLAKDLIGKVLITKDGNIYTSGIITEAEAYCGVTDRASHAYGGRRTARTEMMYAEGGVAYMYICYGIHDMFNIVTNEKDVPEAILIRAVYPLEGIEHMLKRRNRNAPDKTLAGGPGTVAQAFGLNQMHNGAVLTGSKIWIEDRGIYIPSKEVQVTKRIGVEGAKDAAHYPYRFVIPYKVMSRELGVISL